MMGIDMAEYDSARLAEIRGRNVKRVHEIDVILVEVQPLFERLLRERDQCSAIIRRIDPPPTSGFAADCCTSGAQTPEPRRDDAQELVGKAVNTTNTAQTFGHRG